MPDHLLHELAEDVPPLRTGFAEEILLAARRRTRRHRAVLATIAATAVVAVAVPVAVALSGGYDTSLGAAATSPAPTTSNRATASGTPSTSGAVVVPASADAQIYAATLRYALHNPAGPQRPRVLLVLTTTCTNVPDAGIGTCGAKAIPAGVQTEVTRLVGTAATVRWVDTFRTVTPDHPGLEVPDAEHVTFSPIVRTDAHRASLWIEQLCQFDCVLGTQLRLTETGGTWRATGGGGMYIS